MTSVILPVKSPNMLNEVHRIIEEINISFLLSGSSALRLREETGKGKVKCLGVFLGERQVQVDGINIYPAMQFLKLLWGDEVVR